MINAWYIIKNHLTNLNNVYCFLRALEYVYYYNIQRRYNLNKRAIEWHIYIHHSQSRSLIEPENGKEKKFDKIRKLKFNFNEKVNNLKKVKSFLPFFFCYTFLLSLSLSHTHIICQFYPSPWHEFHNYYFSFSFFLFFFNTFLCALTAAWAFELCI